MKEWVLNKIVEWLASSVTPEKIKEWTDGVKNTIFPWLRVQKDVIIAKLKIEAKKTDTVIDDVGVDLLDKFFDALLPDNPKVL